MEGGGTEEEGLLQTVGRRTDLTGREERCRNTNIRQITPNHPKVWHLGDAFVHMCYGYGSMKKRSLNLKTISFWIWHGNESFSPSFWWMNGLVVVENCGSQQLPRTTGLPTSEKHGSFVPSLLDSTRGSAPAAVTLDCDDQIVVQSSQPPAIILTSSRKHGTKNQMRMSLVHPLAHPGIQKMVGNDITSDIFSFRFFTL